MNKNIKTEMQKTPVEWTELINQVISKIEENGYPHEVRRPEIIRLLVHYRPARENLNKALGIIINGFQGVKEVNQNVKKYMRGIDNHAISQE